VRPGRFADAVGIPHHSEEETGSSAFYTEEVGLHMSAETAVKTTT
jgi:hypothetical protein